jgi:hypothetical protein
VSDQKISTGYDLSKFDFSVVQSAINGEKIALAVEGSSDKPAPATILYSDDNGKSYKSIWSGNTGATTADLGDQITSLAFSTDGSILLFGHLPEVAGQNRITEVTLNGENKANVLATIDQAGAFIHAYNKASGEIVYTSSCYNCGGGVIKKVFMFNANDKRTSLLIESSQGISPDIQPNRSFEKILYAENSIEEGVITSDTVVKEVSLKDKKIQTLFTKPKADPQVVQLGYMSDGSTPYYMTEKSVVSLGSNKQTDIFTTDKKILDVLYVSKTEIIVQTGEPEGAFTVSKFTMANKELTKILDGTATTHRLIGITANN